jgi:hypothetical protein
MLSAALYARVRILDYHCTRDRGCSAHPAFPAPSVFEGESYLQTSGELRREIVKLRLARLRGLAGFEDTLSL